MAASVWIMGTGSWPMVGTKRPSADTMPLVTVDARPNGLPMAMVFWPTSRSSESAMVRAWRGRQLGLIVQPQQGQVEGRVHADHVDRDISVGIGREGDADLSSVEKLGRARLQGTLDHMEVGDQEGLVAELDQETAAIGALHQCLIAEEALEAFEVLWRRVGAPSKRRVSGAADGDVHGHHSVPEAIDDLDGVELTREQGARFIERLSVLGDDGRAKTDRDDRGEGHDDRGHREPVLGSTHGLIPFLLDVCM